MLRTIVLTLAALLLLPAAVTAQDSKASGESSFEKEAEKTLRQPLKDLGIMKEEAPEILAAAQVNPYGLSGLRNCRDFARAVAELTEILGPDVDAPASQGEPLVDRLAKAGAGAAASALIPFRGLVREATGAAQADRELRAALLAGTARRSYIRGYAAGRGCKT